MIAGAITEWVGKHFYATVPQEKLYETMFGEAEKLPPGSGGVFVLPSFIRGMGPFSAHSSLGTILGLTTATERGQLVRATLESLCFQMRRQMEIIQSEAGVKAQRLRALGGAQKNPLWLQLKADVSGLPLEILLNEEVTLLGAAILAGVGAGVFRDFHSAFNAMSFPVRTFEPDAKRHAIYSQLYTDIFQRISPSLKDVYGRIAGRF
jgi:xylulokinase